MNDRVCELAAAGRALVPEDRLETVSDLDGVWVAEVKRRVAAHELGEGELLDVDQVLADAARIAP